MRTVLEELKGRFWTTLDELVDEIEECGAVVTEFNREYLEVIDEFNDEAYIFKLSGIERTIIIESIEEC